MNIESPQKEHEGLNSIWLKVNHNSLRNHLTNIDGQEYPAQQ